jgi:transcriptional regulator with XRE-family HTH domain
MIDVSVRCNLRDRRLARGLSLRQLAQLSGVDRGNISKYERNVNDMNVSTAAKFAVLLNCTLDDLFDIERK